MYPWMINGKSIISLCHLHFLHFNFLLFILLRKYNLHIQIKLRTYNKIDKNWATLIHLLLSCISYLHLLPHLFWFFNGRRISWLTIDLRLNKNSFHFHDMHIDYQFIPYGQFLDFLNTLLILFKVLVPWHVLTIFLSSLG